MTYSIEGLLQIQEYNIKLIMAVHVVHSLGNKQELVYANRICFEEIQTDMKTT